MRETSLLEPLSCAVHAARLARDLGGLDVAIFGGGTIGLSVLLTALYQEAARVVVTGRKETKRALALKWRADFAVDGTFPGCEKRVREVLGDAPDIVVDCIASGESLAEAQQLVARGGTVIVLGASHDQMPGPIAAVQKNEITILGSAMQTPTDFDRAVQIMRARPGTGSLVTAEFPVEQAADAYACALGGTGTKVQLVRDSIP